MLLCFLESHYSGVVSLCRFSGLKLLSESHPVAQLQVWQAGCVGAVWGDGVSPALWHSRVKQWDGKGGLKGVGQSSCTCPALWCKCVGVSSSNSHRVFSCCDYRAVNWLLLWFVLPAASQSSWLELRDFPSGENGNSGRKGKSKNVPSEWKF